MLPMVDPQADASPGDSPGTGAPWSTRRVRFWRTATTAADIEISRFHCPTVTVPSWVMTRDAAPSTRGAKYRLSAKYPPCESASWTPPWKAHPRERAAAGGRGAVEV